MRQQQRGAADTRFRTATVEVFLNQLPAFRFGRQLAELDLVAERPRNFCAAGGYDDAVTI